MQKFESIIFRTENLNYYIFSNSLGCILYSHPIMTYLLREFNIFDSEIEKLNFDKEEEDYYRKKIQFYIKYSVFRPSYKDHLFFDFIDKVDIVNSISNTEQLAIELIQDCNLKCAYCVYGNLYKNPFKHNSINLSSVLVIIDNLFEYWNFRCEINNEIRINYYGGEPLLKFDDIVYITEYIKSKNSNLKFSFGITTNATLLDKEKVQYFAKNKFVLTISLDGDKNANGYRLYKNGCETYETIVKNVDYICQLFPDYYAEYVHFISVVHDKNIDFDIKKYFIDKFECDKVNIGSLNTIDISEDKKEEFERMYRRKFSNKDDFNIDGEIYRYQKEIYKIKEVYPFVENSNNRFHIRTYTGTCLPLKKKLFITADCKLMPCEKISFSNNFGQICFNGNFVDIDLQQIAKKFNNSIEPVVKQCRKCYYSLLCSTCVYTMKKRNGTFHCDKCMNKESFSLYLSKIISYLENL